MSTHSGPITSWCVCVSICMRVCAQSAIQYRLLIFPSLCVLFLSLSSALTYNCSSMPLGPSVSLLHRRINSLCSVPCACVCPPPFMQEHFQSKVILSLVFRPHCVRDTLPASTLLCPGPFYTEVPHHCRTDEPELSGFAFFLHRTKKQSRHNAVPICPLLVDGVPSVHYFILWISSLF